MEKLKLWLDRVTNPTPTTLALALVLNVVLHVFNVL